MDKRRSHEITLCCKRWKVQFQSLSDCDGFCHAEAKTIGLDRRLKDAELRRVFIHEALHALFWFIDEDIIDESSKELSEALDDLDL